MEMKIIKFTHCKIKPLILYAGKKDNINFSLN